MWLNTTWTSILLRSKSGGNTKSRLYIERTRTRNKTRLECSINFRSSLWSDANPRHCGYSSKPGRDVLKVIEKAELYVAITFALWWKAGCTSMATVNGVAKSIKLYLICVLFILKYSFIHHFQHCIENLLRTQHTPNSPHWKVQSLSWVQKKTDKLGNLSFKKGRTHHFIIWPLWKLSTDMIRWVLNLMKLWFSLDVGFVHWYFSDIFIVFTCQITL